VAVLGRLTAVRRDSRDPAEFRQDLLAGVADGGDDADADEDEGGGFDRAVRDV
jgi:hypothetical protein